MDPQEPIHGVIGVDRALGLRVTVRELPLVFCWEATLPTPQILKNTKICFSSNVENNGRDIGRLNLLLMNIMCFRGFQYAYSSFLCCL